MIVGAGASGIMAASVAKTSHTIVELYEKNARIGKKILVSGNGRCNIANTSIKKYDYYGEDISFAEAVVRKFGFSEFKEFCSNIGLLLEIKEDKRVYPLSNESKSVVSIFEANLKKLGVGIFTQTPVVNIKKKNGKFIAFNDKGLIGEYDKVLLTTGLLAAPQLGGCTDGINLASKFGHSFNELYPVLVPLELQGSFFKRMDGVKRKVSLSLYINKKKVKSVVGDVLFTRYGISGFAVLDISFEASFYLKQGYEVGVSINLFPQLNKSSIIKYIETERKTLKGYAVLNVLCGILPVKIAKAVLIKHKIDMDLDIALLDIKHIKAIINELFGLKFIVKSTRGFEYAEACGGGIKTKDIDVNTMESKLVKGLYFAGEILDVVGRRGGYNLSFSFASGYLAGRSLASF